MEKQSIKVSLLIGLVGLAVGVLLGSRIFEQAMQDKLRADRQLAVLRSRMENQEQELANARMESKVDKIASEEVRRELVDLQARLKERNNELTLFRNLLKSSEDIKQGIGIKELSLKQTSEGVAYRLVIYQKELHMKTINVQISVSLIGDMDGGTETLPLMQLDRMIGKKNIVKFKYFHVMTGTLQLPKGFSPSNVRVEIWPVGQFGKKVERDFPWQPEVAGPEA